MIPVAIFARVSTESQDFTRQINELEQVASKNNWKVVAKIASKISGYKTKREERKDIDELLLMARSGRIKKVLVSEVSRLGRRPSDTAKLLEDLEELKVSIYSHNYGLETLLPNGKRNPAASLIFAIFGELARTERDLLSERIKSGQREAERKGKCISRPKGSFKSNDKFLAEQYKVVRYIKEGQLSIREIAKLTDTAPGTVMKVKRVLKEMKQS